MQDKIVILMPPHIGRTMSRLIAETMLKTMVDSNMPSREDVVEYRGKRAYIHVLDDSMNVDYSCRDFILKAITKELDDKLSRDIIGDGRIPTPTTRTDGLASIPYSINMSVEMRNPTHMGHDIMLKKLIEDMHKKTGVNPAYLGR